MTSPIAGNEGFIAISNISAPVNNISVGGAASVQEVDITGAFNSAFDGVGLGVVKEVIGYAPTSFSTLAVYTGGSTNVAWLNTKKGLAAATSTSDANLLKLPNGARVLSAHITNNGTAITSATGTAVIEAGTGLGPGNTPGRGADYDICIDTPIGSGSTGTGINAFFGAMVGGGPSLGLGENGADGVAPNPIGGPAVGVDTNLGVTNTNGYVWVINEDKSISDYNVGTILNTFAATAAQVFEVGSFVPIDAQSDDAGGITEVTTAAMAVASTTGVGTGMTITVTTTAAAQNVDGAIVTPTVVAVGSGYAVGDTVTIATATIATAIGVAGAAGTITVSGDLVVTLTAAHLGGAADAQVVGLSGLDLEAIQDDITGGNVTITDSAATASATFTVGTNANTSGVGTGAVITVTLAGNVIGVATGTAVVTSAGTGFKYGDTITVTQAQLIAAFADATAADVDLVFTLQNSQGHLSGLPVWPSTFVGSLISTRSQSRVISGVTAISGDAGPALQYASVTSGLEIPFNPAPSNSTYNILGTSEDGSGEALTAGDLAMKIKYLL